ncbi:MAG: molybdate ABC transporter substrate-binding protein [Acidobacteria bacterium]|jgi:molybdate transport system substrate-binding protein|nr:MAG: molybdate ABC transporter substrate-binding protein [Acidobacteriota bacterium]
MLRRVFFILLLTFAFSKAELIRVFAAADLQYALREIADMYKTEHPEDKVELIFGSSGKGFAQIKSGAPYHIFFSANMKYVEELYKEGYIITKPKPYAIGRLVVWVHKDSGLEPSKFPQILLDPKVRRIAIANWEHAPYGVAAKQVLESYGVFDKIKDKLVLGENVAQTASYVYSGAADVGIIPLSLAVASSMEKVGTYWLVPEDKHLPIVQGYGITKTGENSQAVRRFYEFVGSPKARRIFIKYGFVLPGEK